MKILSTSVHGIIDYLMGVFLIVSPWILNFNYGGAETWIPVILGAGVIVYSLITDYERGAAHVLSMRTHLALDFLGGLFLAVSPWLFGFSDIVVWPHVILGVAEMGAALMTDTVPSYERKHKHSHGHA